MKHMQQYVKKAVEQAISWAVPVVCASALVMWESIPEGAQHYWPVACIAVLGLYSLTVACQDRRDIRRHIKMHDERRTYDENIARVFRAILDAEMGNLYAACVARGYTTEDERRLYDRLHGAYESVGGNGEAKRRKVHYEAIPYEEEWLAGHGIDE